MLASPLSPGSSSFSKAELRLVMFSVKKLVFSSPETGEVYMLLVQSLSSKFYTDTCVRANNRLEIIVDVSCNFLTLLSHDRFVAVWWWFMQKPSARNIVCNLLYATASLTNFEVWVYKCTSTTHITI